MDWLDILCVGSSSGGSSFRFIPMLFKYVTAGRIDFIFGMEVHDDEMVK